MPATITNPVHSMPMAKKSRRVSQRTVVTAPPVERLRPDVDLQLDPENPRLSFEAKKATQDEIIRVMLRDFRIEDVAESILASGWRPFDPLIGYRTGTFVIIREGNRRTTALKLLLDPSQAPAKDRAAWTERSKRVTPELRAAIERVDVIVFADPKDEVVDAYMGFRHVSGTLQWPPEEKARYIEQLIERHGWSYREIAERLGSYGAHVEKLYVASRVIQQAREDEVEGADRMTIGTLLRALQAAGVREFLSVTYPNNPKKSKRPVDDEKADALADFVKWAFGTDDAAPVLKDSRDLTKFGTILRSPEAVRYLRSAERPNLDRAWMKSGGQRETLVETLFAAADRLEESAALTPQYAMREDDEGKEIEGAIDRCALFLAQILRDYPQIKARYFSKRGGDA
jgi:hypothetical protein